MEKPTVIVICGPTASGKTALSIELAKRINGEIVSADSMQIYKDMDIGSAKVTKDEMQGIEHYLIDQVYPNERYSVANYKQDAKAAIEEILEGIYGIQSPKFYDNKVGLVTDNKWLEETYII